MTGGRVDQARREGVQRCLPISLKWHTRLTRGLAWSSSRRTGSEAVRPVVEKLGGKFEHAWLAFGESNIVGVVELPENTDAAAFAMAVYAGGAVKAFKTTPLLSVAEGVEAMRKAQGAGYGP